MKTFPPAQIPLIERPHSEPLYFAHIYLSGEILYFSDRNFKFNAHDYEAYLFDIPETLHSINQTGGYLNISANLAFRNIAFRSYAKLIDFFIANPITRREMDLFVLYLDNGQIPGTDISTKLHRLGFGEIGDIATETFTVPLSSILHLIDAKKVFTQINRTNWPNAGPDSIGKFENQVIGSLRNIPCYPVNVGAVSTLYSDLSATATEIYLSDVNYPVAFPSSGTVQIGIEQITYTSKDSTNKKLTGCTRGSPARAYTKGEPVWEIKSTYKYLAAGHKMKSISDVYIAGIRVAPGDRTVNLNDSGKSTIAFTSKNLLKNQGAHSHGSKIEEPWNPIGSSFTYDSGMGAWGAAANLKDKDEGTGCGVGLTGAVGSNKDAYFTATFPTWNGLTPNAVYVHVVCNWNLGFVAGEYFNLTAPESISIGIQGQSNSTYTAKIKLSGTSVPTTVTCRAHTNAGNPVQLIVGVYEMWLELEFDNIASGGENSIWSKLVPMVTCDGEGYQDDGSGTYTGILNALIEVPSDTYRFFLRGLLGRSGSEIGDSFSSVRTIQKNQISGGYKFGMILSEIGRSPEEIIRNLDGQCCSQLREDGGKFELSWNHFQISADQFMGGTATASSTYAGSASNVFDDNESTGWVANGVPPQWMKYDFGPGNAKILTLVRIKPYINYPGVYGGLRQFKFQGSNNDIDWTTLVEGEVQNNENWQNWTFINSTAYRYHRLYIESCWAVTWPALREIEGKVYDTTPPSSVLTIDKTIYIGDPVFGHTSSTQIKNVIRALYDFDWSLRTRGRYGNFFKQVERKASGLSEELPEDVSFLAIQVDEMAYDVAEWQRIQKKDIMPTVALICNRRVRILERGDYFTLNDCPVAPWEGKKWRVLEIRETPDQQAFSIRAIQWVSL